MYHASKRNLALLLVNLRVSAGFKDTSTLLLFSTATAVHTGNFGRSVRLLFTGDFVTWFSTILTLVAFFIGSMVSGLLFPNNEFQLTYKYSYCYFTFSLISFVLLLIGASGPYVFTFVAFTLGFQNAFDFYYGGQIVRTTLLSSTLTKAGKLIGKWIRRKANADDIRDISFHFNNILLFLLGVVVACVIYFYTSLNLILAVSLLDLFTGLHFFKDAREIITENK